MNERLTITSIKNIKNQEFHLELDESINLEHLKASGQMLVDSDGLSFVYLLEKNDLYTYLYIPDGYWNDLKEIKDNTIPVFVTNSREKILLSQFQEELVYLIENIKGNSNYGEKMMNKVEELF